jgi:predicted ester cyclase
VFAPDVVTIDPGAGRMEGLEAFRAYGEAFLRAFPDGRLKVGRIVAETAESIVVEGTFSGTHTGPLTGPDGEIPPTGRRLELHFVDVFDARDGRICEHHVYYDQMAMLGQLGLIPAPA